MRFKRLLTVGLMALLGAGTATAASQLNSVQVTPAANAATVNLRTSGSYAHKEYRPDEHLMLVDLTGVTADPALARTAPVNSAALKSYKLSTYTSASGSQVTRIELVLGEGVTTSVSDESYGLKIQLNSGGPTISASSVGSSSPSPSSAAAPNPVPAAATPAQPPSSSTPPVAKSAPPPQPAPALTRATPAVQLPAHPAEPKAAAASSAPAMIRSVSVSHGQGTLDILIEGPSSARPFLLKDPDRLVLDFPNTLLKPSVKNIAVHTKEVLEIRVGRFQSEPPVARIVIDLSGPHAFDVVPSDHQVLVRVKLGEAASPSPHSVVLAPTSSEVHSVVLAPTSSEVHSVALAPASSEVHIVEWSDHDGHTQSSHPAPVSASLTPPAAPVAPVAAPAVVKPAAAPFTAPVVVVTTPPPVAAAVVKPAVAPAVAPVVAVAVAPPPPVPVVKPAVAPVAAPVVAVTTAPAVAPVVVVTTAPVVAQTVAAPVTAPVVAVAVAAPVATPAVSNVSQPSTALATAPKPQNADVLAALPRFSQPVVEDARANSPAMQQSSVSAASPRSSATKYTGEPISVNLKDVDLKDFFRLIHEISGLNIVLDPSVKGSVTLVLDDVPWDQALDIVLKNNALDRELQGNVLRIAATDTLRKEAVDRRAQTEAVALSVDRQTITRFLSYGKAKEVVPVIKKFLTARGDVISDDRTNALIISDIPSVLPTLDRLISQLDKKSQEVEIEVRVISATRSFSRDLGFQLGFNWGNGVTTLGGSNPNGSTLLTPAGTASSVPLFSSFPATGPTTGFSFSNITAKYGIEAILTAAENHNLAKVLSRPRVVTQSNVKAEIKQGVKLPITTAATANANATTSYIDSVLRLSVTPQITADNTIFLTVDIENTQPTGTANNDGNYILSTQQTTTQVLVTDGGTVVIGGIIQTTNSVSTTQTPVLGNIPWLGNLFKERLVKTETDELIFFITPKIIQT
jgi:type IV pilus assembly protein PilQ